MDDPDARPHRFTEELPPDDAALARRELAAALRDVLAQLASTDAEASALREAAAHARALAEELAATTRERAGDHPMADFRERGPITGLANPMAPPFRMWPDFEARVARGEGRFGSAYEGGPGIAHGGFVAAVLDELLGMATIFSGGPGVTGELTVRYRRPTPLHRDLIIEARLDGQQGRRLAVSGELRDGETLLVEAHGLFIAVGQEHFDELDRTRRQDAG